MRFLKECYHKSLIYSLLNKVKRFFKDSYLFGKNIDEHKTKDPLSYSTNVNTWGIYKFFRRIDLFFNRIEKKIFRGIINSSLVDKMLTEKKPRRKKENNVFLDNSFVVKKIKEILNLIKLEDFLILIPTSYLILDFIFRDLFPMKEFGKIWDEILFILMLLAFIIKRIKNNGELKYKFTPMDLPILIFTGMGIVHVFLVSPDLKIAVQGFRVVFQYIMWYFLFTQFINNYNKSNKVINFLIIIGLILGIHSIFQYVIGVEMPATWIDITESIKTRAYSIVGSPNILGSIFVLLIPISISKTIVTKKTKTKIFYFITSLVMCLGIVLTFSRGAWLSLAVSLFALIVLINIKYIYYFIVGVSLFVLYGGTFSQRLLFMLSPTYLISSAKGGRIYRWLDGIKIWGENKFLGLGLGRFGGAIATQNNLTPYYMDNYYLKTMLEMGIYGLSGLILLVMYYIHFALKIIRYQITKENKIIVIGAFAGTVGILFQNFFENVFEVPVMVVYFWLFVAIINSFAPESEK
ncbi:MAG: O-antigen ligase family protein [Bacilli bacterium]